jgi:putative Holliday junction resolvase
MKTIGLDLGSVTCGIAISDALGWIAQALTTVRFESDDYEDALAKVIAVCKEQKVTDLVLGLPKHMNGDVGIRGQICLDFAEKLKAEGFNVTMWDERLTTAAAQRILIGADVSRKKRKKVIDQMAAVQILQSYLDSKSLR